MKNYHAYCAGWFNISKEEIDKLPKHYTMRMDSFIDNCIKLSKFFCMDIVDFTLKALDKKLKRNTWDSAILLVVKLRDGRLLAKRHNNSQHLFLP